MKKDWLNPMLRKLRRLSKLSPVELLVFFQLFFFALAARLMLRFTPLSRVIKVLSASAHNPLLQQFPISHRWQDYSQLVVVADLAARAIRPEGPCLLRSLLLLWLLKARGEHAELLIGVRKDSGLLASHAWIESHDKIIGENEPGPARFINLARF